MSALQLCASREKDLQARLHWRKKESSSPQLTPESLLRLPNEDWSYHCRWDQCEILEPLNGDSGYENAGNTSEMDTETPSRIWLRQFDRRLTELRIGSAASEIEELNRYSELTVVSYSRPQYELSDELPPEAEMPTSCFATSCNEEINTADGNESTTTNIWFGMSAEFGASGPNDSPQDQGCEQENSDESLAFLEAFRAKATVDSTEPLAAESTESSNTAGADGQGSLAVPEFFTALMAGATTQLRAGFEPNPPQATGRIKRKTRKRSKRGSRNNSKHEELYSSEVLASPA
jgi:hypothetical protein